MNYRIPSLLYTLCGFLIFVFSVVLGVKSIDSDLMSSLILMGAGFMVMTLFYGMSSDTEIAHIKRVLKKNGLWQDQMIKKSELPK